MTTIPSNPAQRCQPSIESERQAFKRAYQHCDLSEETNMTGELEFKAPYIAAAWDGWLTRSDAIRREAQSVEGWEEVRDILYAHLPTNDPQAYCLREKYELVAKQIATALRPARSSAGSASALADKFESCDHAVFYFDAGKDEPMRGESLEPDDYELIASALRAGNVTKTEAICDAIRLLVANGYLVHLGVPDVAQPSPNAFDDWFESHFLDPDGGSSHFPDWFKGDMRRAWDAALSSTEGK